MNTIFVILEEQSDWHWDGEQSIESITEVPIRATATIEEAQEYIRRSNSDCMKIKAIPFGLGT